MEYEVARALKAPLDVFIARKLGAPNQPELGIGAVAQDGSHVLNERIVEEIGVSEEYIERVAAEEAQEAERFLTARADARRMIEKGSGVILRLSSGAVRMYDPGFLWEASRSRAWRSRPSRSKCQGGSVHGAFASSACG